MRRMLTTAAATTLTIGLLSVPAAAMQPPGEPAQKNFGCVDGVDDPVNGHPGAPGIAQAAARVRDLTGDPTPTAWNAVEHSGPIEFGECS